MKSLKLAILFFALGIFAFANERSMDSVFASLTENAVTSGDFLQEKTSAKLKKPLKSSGTFVFSRDGIIWKTLKPFPSTMAVTKDSIIQRGADGKKTVLDGSSSEIFKTVAASLSAIFSGNQAGIEEHFSIKSFSSNKNSWNLVLSPKDSTVASAISKIELSGISESEKTKKATLESLKIVQGDSNVTTYTLLNQTYKQELSSDEKSLLSK